MPEIIFADKGDIENILKFVSAFHTLDTDEPINSDKARGQLLNYIENVSLLMAKRNGDILGVLGFDKFTDEALRVPFVLVKEEEGLILKFRRFILNSFPKLKIITWRSDKRNEERVFKVIKKEG